MTKTKFRVSFKQRPRETGLRAVGYPYPTVEVKVNGLVVGYIRPPCWSSREHVWNVQLATEGNDANPNRSWGWTFVKQKCQSDEAAREYLKANLQAIHDKHPLHMFED